MSFRDPNTAAGARFLRIAGDGVSAAPAEAGEEEPGCRALVRRPRAALVRAPTPSTLPALREAELALVANRRAIGRRLTKVPGDAFVSLGRPVLPPPPPRLQLPPPEVGPSANDNAAGAKDGRWRAVLREIVLLLGLGAVLAGMYYAGRMSGFHNVIVVPEPWERTSKVT